MGARSMTGGSEARNGQVRAAPGPPRPYSTAEGALGGLSEPPTVSLMAVKTFRDRAGRDKGWMCIT
eukprot:scaffold2390_cov280-Prasinococcus_capsulatus_cf.AAC.2